MKISLLSAPVMPHNGTVMFHHPLTWVEFKDMLSNASENYHGHADTWTCLAPFAPQLQAADRNSKWDFQGIGIYARPHADVYTRGKEIPVTVDDLDFGMFYIPSATLTADMLNELEDEAMGLWSEGWNTSGADWIIAGLKGNYNDNQ